MTENNDRISVLEEKIAYLIHTNDELSGELALQWKRIEVLEKHVNQLEGQFADLAAGMDGPIENTKPPHW